MRKAIEYGVVPAWGSGQNASTLVEEGWQPLGAPFVDSGDQIWQAMVKYEGEGARVKLEKLEKLLVDYQKHAERLKATIREMALRPVTVDELPDLEARNRQLADEALDPFRGLL